VTLEELLRLLLVPAAVWLASLAGRRWGHAVSCYLGGLPLIGGPITFFIALDHGAAFAAQSATVTLAVILAQAAHLTAFAIVAQRARWLVALAAGWSGFTLVALIVAAFSVTPVVALLLAVAGLASAWQLLPRPRGDAALPAIPPTELRLRLVAAFALAVAIIWSANTFGPVVSGVLLSVPVTGSIMPPFTLALYGPHAAARLIRGFVVGLSGFTAFFFVVATWAVSLGITGVFLAAVAAALAAVFLVGHALRIEPAA
jgi:hypothetical protein